MFYHQRPPDLFAAPTFRAVRDLHFRLSCWCPGCKKEARCDVATFIALGMGDHEYARHPLTCRRCGSVGVWQLRWPEEPDPKLERATVLPFPIDPRNAPERIGRDGGTVDLDAPAATP